jgi:hypothetical protein
MFVVPFERAAAKRDEYDWLFAASLTIAPRLIWIDTLHSLQKITSVWPFDIRFCRTGFISAPTGGIGWGRSRRSFFLCRWHRTSPLLVNDLFYTTMVR